MLIISSSRCRLLVFVLLHTQFVLVRVSLCLLVIKLIELDCLSVKIESWLFLAVIGCMLWIMNLDCNFTPCVLLLFYYSNVGFFYELYNQLYYSFYSV